MTDEEIKTYMEETDKATIYLAFCDAAAEVLGEFAHETMQTAAQVDLEMMHSIRELIKTGTADSSILDAVKQINAAALAGVETYNSTAVWERIQMIRRGNATTYILSYKVGSRFRISWYSF